MSATDTTEKLENLDGQNVFIQGDIRASNSAFDEFFNMKASGQPLLERKV